MMRTISIDIETYSPEDLSKAGVYRYAEAPGFRVLLFGYSADGGPVSVVDLENGGTLPPEILEALTDPAVEKNAFNAAFERVCLSRLLREMRRLGEGEFLSPAGWRCTMVRCAYLGMPLSLESAGAVLGLEKQKLTEGKDLVRFFCAPAPPSRLNGPCGRNLPSADPEKWQRFMEYNRRDVETETEIRERLGKDPVPESVWREYELDQAINDRGIAVDRRLVSAAISMDARSREELTAEMSARTGLANPNSVSRVRSWLAEHGAEAKSLGRKQVAAMLEDAGPDIREVLLLRQQLAKSSVKKYEAMRNTVCADGRIRGLFQFYGAFRSGRWAGRGVQLQNLPQNHLPDLSRARDLVLSGDDASLKLLYGSVPDVLSELIRTAFVPAPGKKFIVADFSAIEARVLVWLAGETWRSEVFASGGDIYCASASRMFRVPVEKHGINGHLRQKGKIAELALGYGGSVGALKAMGAIEMGLTEEELPPLVEAWRQSNPNIVKLWWDVDRAAMEAVKYHHASKTHGILFAYRSGMLFITLPSGRNLAYVKPKIGTNKFGGECITFEGTGGTKKWERLDSYGPKLVENIVQATSRDILCYAMKTLRCCSIVMHIHDELVIEADPRMSLQAVCDQMGRTPPWAEGLQLRADGYETGFYKKD